MTELTNDTLIKAMNASLERPSDFGYWGDLPLFDTWGTLPFTQCRDSDVLVRSNFKRVLEDLEEIAANESESGDASEFVQTFNASSWLTGWVEQMVCRVLVDPDGERVPENFTRTFVKAVEISEYLRCEYPIYDESDYSALEYEESQAAFEQTWGSVDWSELGPHKDDEGMKWAAFSVLLSGEVRDSFDEDDIVSTVLGLVWDEAWAEYAETYKYQLTLF